MPNHLNLPEGQTLRDYAYARIRTEIINGTLAPGTPISEAERADSLGISRSPVREALQKLAREGLVEVFPKRGTFVAELTPRDVREAFELRQAIEAACARYAAERRTVGDLEELERLCDAIDRTSSSADSYDAGAAFHAGVAKAAHSEYLREVFEHSQAKIDMASRAAAHTFVKHDRELTHRDILDAIAEQNADEAERIMKAHLEESAQSLIDRLL